MAPGKGTAPRSRDPRQPLSSEIAHRRSDPDASTSSSSSGSSTPQTLRNTSSESSSSLSPFQSPSLASMELVDNLPDDLIEFVSQGSPTSTSEPPRKRQKMILEQKMASHGESAVSSSISESALDYVIVKQSVWEIQFPTSKLSKSKVPIVRNNIRLHVRQPQLVGPQYLRIDDDTGSPVFQTTLPDMQDGFEDILLALDVDQGKKWAKGQGKLWTEFGLMLLHKKGFDFLHITLTVKWNITTSPDHIVQAAAKVPVLLKILQKYFPDQIAARTEKWSPQDFYQSVHSTDKNDRVAASLQVNQLESTLFPFQKRAVQWMLRKEGVEWSEDNMSIQNAPATKDSVPISFIKAKDANGRSCYVSHLLGLVTLNLEPFQALDRNLSGEILAEEMGLGKTVEMISLILLHRRPKILPDTVFDPYTATDVRPTSATLIIAPPSISRQWISEMNKHAPHLKVAHYEGLQAHKYLSPSELLDNLATSDVVISSYSVLAAEVHFTPLNPEKTLRRPAKYPRPKSPLMALQFFRIVMDEAQMIDSGISMAAVVARMVPRLNAWCVTGTPVRKDVNDLLGLLVFLRCEPYATIKHVWSSLISSQKHDFQKLFGALALRHTKQNVRDELKLPAQRRYVITMPFTPIEEQHYQEMFNRMCEESGLDAQGEPYIDNWDPDAMADTMRNWLVRLRQTALHPEVGGRNRRALGHKDGPLRTVDQVLDVMTEQTDTIVRTDQRALLTTKMKRGQLFENSPRVKEALVIWLEVAKEALAIVEECREQFHQEMTKSLEDKSSSGEMSKQSSGYDSDASDDQADIDPSSRLGTFRNRLRAALEIQHMAVFFCANANFQIKSDEDMTKQDSPEFRELEKAETEGYELAKSIRQEILQEIYHKADRLMKKLAKRAASQSFVQVPEFATSLPKGGLESRRIIEQLDILGIALDAQANQLDEWREQTIKFLLRPLVDEDEGLEITGDEYEDSKKHQDEVLVFVQALRTVISDRHDALTGQVNELIAVEVKTALRWAKEGKGPFPEKILELLETRRKLKPAKEMGSIRSIVSELRGLATSLRMDAQTGNTRAQNELSIVETQLNATQKQLSQQTKATTGLEKEIEFFTRCMNTRLEYYRQLQQISDMVAPYEGPNNEKVLAKMLQDEEKLGRKIASAKAKRRYLVHLKMEASNPQDQRICVICRDTFEIGALTVCGHQYCKECIQLWWSAHHNCPVCKKKLIQADLHEITYKPQELSIEAEEVHESSLERASPSSTSKKSAIYSEISKSTLAEIKNIELDGPSFTTKVDTLARHLIWLRESDPGAKSIIFSQFKDFLNVLALAFKRFRIGFSSIDRPNGIEKFKMDPSVECFLLHARAHSSGLNLANASHVFLCEPLLNTALELQAIARVDRIGQHQETNVWLYLVDGTVEESIHQLSVKRRMEHIGKRLARGKGKERDFSPDQLLDTNLEEANSMELEQASLTGLLAKGGKGGEMVAQDDLWDCLFGGVAQRQKNIPRTLDNSDLRQDREVERHLRAEAAEARISEE